MSFASWPIPSRFEKPGEVLTPHRANSPLGIAGTFPGALARFYGNTVSPVNNFLVSRRGIALKMPSDGLMNPLSANRYTGGVMQEKAGKVWAFRPHLVRWSDVHSDRIEYVAKGGRRCSVPLVNGLQSVLDRLRPLEDGSGYVLPRAQIRRGLAKACAGVGLRRLTHHDFRHLFATRAIESGVDVPTVARWLGHQDGGALLSRRYFHLLDEHSRTMAARVRI